MPDELTEQQVEEAVYRGQRKALEEQEARLRPNPNATLHEAFDEADDPRVVRARRRRTTGHLGGDDGDE